MVEETGNSVHGTGSNPLPIGQHEDTISQDGARDSMHETHERYQRDNVSRLSEGLEPLHLNGQTPLRPKHDHSARQIDALGVHVKDAITTIGRLESLGLQRLKIPLPKIIVLGEQSTGKSSVIEAISAIKTPRSTGTCTRCPLFIKLESPSDLTAGWTAHVSLRRSFTYDAIKGRGSVRRFPGWTPMQEPTTVEFMSTDSPESLEDIIVRAQLATTCPFIEPEKFTQPDIHHLKGEHYCSFSPNIICISISHPGLPALSFYDLPGIIGQSDTPEDVTFVKNLVIDYIKDPEALILVTCSMETDIANSTAGGMARTLKATDRCIGVLTKPDRLLPSTCADTLRDMFVTKRFPFRHGYFVVRNLGQEQLDQGFNHATAREQERHFFTTHEPFSTTFREHESRFGTWNLQAFLSGKLAEQILKKLPVIEEEIQARLSDIGEKLKQYPETPTHTALRNIFDVVLAFTQHVRLEVEGDHPCRNWRNNWKALKKALFGSLMTLKPTMSTMGIRDTGIYRASLSGGASANDSIVLESDEEVEEDTNGNTRMSNTPETPSKKRKAEGTPGPSPLKTPANGSASSRTANAAALNPDFDFSNMRTKFQLDAIAQHLEEASNASLPGHCDHRVTEEMTLQTLQHWQLPLYAFFNTLEQSLKSQIKILFHKHFATKMGTPLYDTAWTIVMEMVSLNLRQQRTTMAIESLEDEKNSLYIFHRELYNHEKVAIMETYRQARYKARMALYKNERARSTGAVMIATEEAKMLKNAKLMALLHEEPYRAELDVAADITTYYTIAVQRFHDSICMRIESKFFKQLRTQLRDKLENRLGIHDETEGHRNAVKLLTENPQREEQRQALLAQKSALMQGQQILDELKIKKYGDGSCSQTAGAHVSQSSSGLHTPTSNEMEV